MALTLSAFAAATLVALPSANGQADSPMTAPTPMMTAPTPGNGGGTVVRHVKDESYSFFASTTIVTDTEPGTCYDYDDDFFFDYSAQAPTPPRVGTPCEKDCAGTDYNINAFTTEDGEMDVVSIRASRFNFCADGGDYEFFSATVDIDVPPAIWTQTTTELNSEGSGVLEEPDYGDYNGIPPEAVQDPSVPQAPSPLGDVISARPPQQGPNPLAGIDVSYKISVSCTETELTQSQEKCTGQEQGPVYGGSFRTSSFFLNKDCSLEDVGTLTVNGVDYTFDNINFGKFKSRNKRSQVEPGSLAFEKSHK